MLCKLEDKTLHLYVKQPKMFSKQDTKKILSYLQEEILKPQALGDLDRLYYLVTRTELITTWTRIYHQIMMNDRAFDGKKINSNEIEDLLYLNQTLMDFWINLDKYVLINSQKQSMALNNTYTQELVTSLNQVFLSFRELLSEYNTEAINLPNFLPKAVISTSYLDKAIPATYKTLNQVETIVKAQINTPFITRTSANTRTGLFSELNRPFDLKKLIINDFYMMGVKVGRLLMHIYLHQSYLHHGISLFNLFEKASLDELQTQQPKGILFFGIDDKNFHATYHYDDVNDIYIGHIYRDPRYDYFGYMKKMLLTLFNLHYIEKKALPLHGAMVSIQLMDDSIKNIIIIGDSGAGKSETLEAFRLIGQTMIKKMKIVFDDMGILEVVDNNIVASGTEIGAFVRIDDLASGYAFEYLNDAMLVNPERVNARLIMKVTDYETVIKNHHVDIILYANNYDANDRKLKVFQTPEEAVEVFARGQRIAKGTTTEMGMAKNFFANPFGPVQKQENVFPIMKEYFKFLFNKNIIVGELYTQLAIEGYEFEGPRQAATALIDYLNSQGNL